MKPVPPWVAPGPIVYPESDGLPIAESTKQCDWIILLYNNLSAQFRLRQDVFVAADLFWYPVERHPEIRTAPDGLVVFGRPKGDRGSYRQWEEDNIPVTVAFEVLGPSMTAEVQGWKRAFYEEDGVEEYYVYDPDRIALEAYLRRGNSLAELSSMDGFVSPHLGIRFDLSGPEMKILGPDGRPFASFQERYAEYMREQEALQQRDQANQQVAESAKRLARTIELNRKFRRGQLSPEELEELERLENETLGE